MSYSSSLSEALEPESSNSLDTMLGLSTKTGQETAVTPSSSSRTQALTDPTLASSESSRPPTPPLERRGRPPPAPWPGPQPSQDGGPSAPHLALPLGGDPAEQYSAAPASGSVPASHTAVSGQQRPAQNTGAAPGPAPSSGDCLGAVLPQAGAAMQPVDILQVLQQMQNMIMLMLQQMQRLLQPGPGHGEADLLPPLTAASLVRPPAQSRENPWVAPDFSREPDVCRQWDMQQEHICLHSYAPSDRSSGSAGSLRRTEVPGLPGAAQRLPPVSSRQPCPMDQWGRCPRRRTSFHSTTKTTYPASGTGYGSPSL